MTLPTHILAALIIGKVSGDYPTALIGSLAMDADHTISYYRHGILFKPRKLLKAILDEEDPWDDQRNFLHTFYSWMIISAFLLLINFKLGLVFSIAYFFHLALDALDGAVFYPLFPSKKFVIKGFIGYYSKKEVILDIILILVFLGLFL